MDIYGVEVIKSGAAYGIRGSNGVINFETHKGNYNSGFSFNTALTTEGVSRMMTVLSPEEFINGGGQNLGSSTDWRSLVLQKALTQVYNLAYSNHFKNTDVRISGNYRHAEGVLKNSGFQQFNGRLYLQSRFFNNKLRLTAQSAVTTRNADIAFNEAFTYAHSFNPTAPIYDSQQLHNGGYFESFTFDTYNPLSIIEQNWHKNKTLAYTGSLKAEWQINEDFKFVANAMLENQDLKDGIFYSKTSFYKGAIQNGLAFKNKNAVANNYLNAGLSYDKQINQWNIKANAGYEFQNLKYTQTALYTRDFDKNATNFDELALGKKVAYDADSLKPVEKTTWNNHILAGFYTHTTLDFKQIYFLSLGFRYDGSSRLGIDKKWTPQPNIGMGIDIARLIDWEYFNTFKLRGSYSTTSAAPYQAGIATEQYRYSPNKQLNLEQMSNLDLGAEIKREWNGGLDFVFWGERLYGSVDVYQNKVSDIISQTRFPIYDTNIWANTATLQNKGIELTLRGTPISKYDKLPFSWETGLTFNKNKSKILDFSKGFYGLSPEFQGLNNYSEFYVGHAELGCLAPIMQVKEGEQLGNFRGYIFSAISENGVSKYVMDTEGQPVSTIIGNSLPKWTGAWSNSVRVGQFEMGFILRGGFGFDIVNEYRGFHENGAYFGSNKIKTEYSLSNAKDLIRFSDYTLEKGNFVKLDNLNLSYTFDKIGKIKGVRLYILSDNLFVFTKYSGSDAEIRYTDNFGFMGQSPFGNQSNFNRNLTPGIDRRATYPFAKSVTFGVNMRF